MPRLLTMNDTDRSIGEIKTDINRSYDMFVLCFVVLLSSMMNKCLSISPHSIAHCLLLIVVLTVAFCSVA